MKNIFLSLALVALLLGAGCSSSDSGAQAALTNLDHDGLSSYISTFDVQFYGPIHWAYQLTTRKTPDQREMGLHLIGIEGSNNPGDVRLVTDGTTSWMTGPGTENECVQFPNGQGMDPTLIYPATLVDGKQLAEALRLSGEEQIEGRPSLRYSGKVAALSGWKDAQVDVWLDREDQSMLQFKMQASGDDPFFNTGSGRLTAEYKVIALDGGAIQPVAGCEIAVPLPPAATNVVRLPGLASFESSAGLDEIRAFYQSQLPAARWTEKDAPAQADGATILSYQRDKEGVEIHITEGVPAGSSVKLIFIAAP